ncbi:MAG TPA: PAS domain-containing protein, partial [Chloroflexia bacterium]|nr:PAS domain-containing protein [Chloroflexia bacterium]
MNPDAALHPLLKRQLKKIGIDDALGPPSAAIWQQFVARVSRAYAEADQERYLLERSLTISSREMQELYESLRASSETRIAVERDRLRTVISALGAGLCLLDPGGGLLFINPEGERLLGWLAADLTGKPLLDVIEVRDTASPFPALTTAALHKVLGAGQTYRNESGRFVRRDGGVLPVSYALNPIMENGVLAGTVLVFLDISVRKRAEMDLQRRLRETLLLNRVIAAGVSALEPNTVLRVACEELARAFHLPQAAVALLDADQTHLMVIAEYCAPGRPAALGTIIPVAGNQVTQFV